MRTVALHWTKFILSILFIHLCIKKKQTQIQKFSLVGSTQFIREVWWLTYMAQTSCNHWLLRVVGRHHLSFCSSKQEIRQSLSHWVSVICQQQHNSETWSTSYIPIFRQWASSNFQPVLLLIQLPYSRISSHSIPGFSVAASPTDSSKLLTHMQTSHPSAALSPVPFLLFSPLPVVFSSFCTQVAALPLSAPWTAVGGTFRAGKRQLPCFLAQLLVLQLLVAATGHN